MTYDKAMCKCHRERLQMLLDIFNDVDTACFAAAAKAVISYTDYLQVLQGLETIVENDCAISMHIVYSYKFENQLCQ